MMMHRNLGWLGAAAVCAGTFSVASWGSTFKIIDVTDTTFAGWAGVPMLASDPADNPGGVDFADVYIANDQNYLYVRLTLHEAADPFTFMSNYFFDTDADSLTGFLVFGQPNFGSEFFIQSGSGFDQRGGTFNEGTLTGVGFLSSSNPGATDYQFRVSRAATYTSDALPVFNGDSIEIVLQTDTGTADVVQDGVFGIPYTFAVPEPSTALAVLGLGGLAWARRRR